MPRTRFLFFFKEKYTHLQFDKFLRKTAELPPFWISGKSSSTSLKLDRLGKPWKRVAMMYFWAFILYKIQVSTDAPAAERFKIYRPVYLHAPYQRDNDSKVGMRHCETCVCQWWLATCNSSSTQIITFLTVKFYFKFPQKSRKCKFILTWFSRWLSIAQCLRL